MIRGACMLPGVRPARIWPRCCLWRGWQGRFGLDDYAVAGAVLLSGIYDVEPLIGTYIDAALHLMAEDAESLSPMRLPPGRRVPVVVAWGENETGGIQAAKPGVRLADRDGRLSRLRV